MPRKCSNKWPSFSEICRLLSDIADMSESCWEYSPTSFLEQKATSCLFYPPRSPKLNIQFSIYITGYRQILSPEQPDVFSINHVIWSYRNQYSSKDQELRCGLSLFYLVGPWTDILTCQHRVEKKAFDFTFLKISLMSSVKLKAA